MNNLSEEILLDMQKIASDIVAETIRAMQLWSPMNSPHEGYAVIKEELEEYWDLVKEKQTKHDYAAMRKELIQLAAMCVRTMLDTGINNH